MRFDDIEYPRPERWVEVDGVRICYVVHPAAGPERRPVLLAPPLGRGVMHYRGNLPGLARLGTVIAYDPPGCGKSQKDRAALALVDVVGQARVAAAVLDAVASGAERSARRALVVGTSYGAMIALALGVDRPESVAGIVLSDAGGERGGILDRWTIRLLSLPFVVRSLGRRAWRRGLTRFYADPNHPAIEPNVDVAMRLRSGPDWHAYSVALSHTTRAAMTFRPAGLIDAARRRCLAARVVWGEHDRVTSISWGRELAAALAAELAVIGDAGHFPNLEQSSAFESAVLAFGESLET
jgi:pimeloyl-ACP methyl ester carboxylesterase